jgi:hypothetical protein
MVAIGMPAPGCAEPPDKYSPRISLVALGLAKLAIEP